MNNNFCSKCIGGRTKGTKAKKRWYGERRGNEDTEGACDDKEGAVRKKKGQWGWRRGNKDKERAVRLNKEQWGRKSKDKEGAMRVRSSEDKEGAVRMKKEQWRQSKEQWDEEGTMRMKTGQPLCSVSRFCCWKWQNYEQKKKTLWNIWYCLIEKWQIQIFRGKIKTLEKENIFCFETKRYLVYL